MVREEDDPHHVPMGLAQLAAIAIKQNHKVQVYDHNAWRASDEELVKVLKSDEWDLISLGGITTAYASIKEIVKLCRKLFTETPIFVTFRGGAIPVMQNVLNF